MLRKKQYKLTNSEYDVVNFTTIRDYNVYILKKFEFF